MAGVGGGIVASRQNAGVRWAYLAGVPVAEFRREGGLSDVAAIGVEEVEADGEGFLLVRQYGFVSGVVGVIEPADSGLRLRFVTDLRTTLSWFAVASPLAAIPIGLALTPPATRIPMSTSGQLTLTLLVVLSLGLLWSFLMRTRRKSAGLAQRLGFAPSGTAQPGAV